jgi:hypothetical protein
MGLFASLVERVSDHPVLFIFFRRILENDFKAIRALDPARAAARRGLRIARPRVRAWRLRRPVRGRSLRRAT